MASAATGELREIKGMAVRHASLLRRLENFSFPLVAAPLAELLTWPENHTATARIEALIHLAALACRGNKEPERRQLREWLNLSVFNDPITELEAPVEDVFVSNVGTWFGNARLFEGRWQNNGDYVEVCVETLLRIAENPWAVDALRHVMALLRVSEAVAERAGTGRYSRTASRPRETIRVSVSTATETRGHVSFSDDELAAVGVNPVDLEPFVFQGADAELLVGQSIGHTALERRPLVRFDSRMTVVLPTAIGATIRRFVIERASAAGDLRLFQSTCHLAQFTEIFLLGRADWGVGYIGMPEPDPGDGMREFVGTFDDGGYFHLVFVPDHFEEITKEGLAGIHKLTGAVRDRVQSRAAELAGKRDYRRGLTVLVHGGIGRAFSPVCGDFPRGWHQLCASAPDFMLLGNETDFTAMRAWKLLQQVDDLEEMGVVFPNLRGFMNLAAFAYYGNFELVPINMSISPIYLHSDFILPLRHRVRTALDRHASIGPDGESWISVQRETTSGHFGETQGRPVFISPAHRGHRQLVACVESASRPWWVQCDQLPEAGWHHYIVFSILDMVLGWLVRLAPALEEQLWMLQTGPAIYRFRFPDIETIDQRDIPMTEISVAPGVTIEDGEIAIDCEPRYLRSFLSAGNLGDRLMIASLVRGAHLLCGKDVPRDTEVKDLVQTVVGSDSARFLKMTHTQTPQDMIYDLAGFPPLRLLMPEDQAWSRLDLVRRAGYSSAPGSIPTSQSGKVLEKAVDCAWERVRSRFVELSRESVIERSLLNFGAAQKEHRDWFRSTAAQFALYDSEQVQAVANERVFRRDTASLACRIIAEMALCTSPYGVGSACTKTDLDFLIAEVSTLLECANQRDGLYHGLMTGQLVMYPNGSFGFEASVAEAAGLLLKEHWARELDDAAVHDGTRIDNLVEGEVAGSGFETAFNAEFGLSMEQYGNFVVRVTLEALKGKNAHLWLRRSELLQRLREVGVVKPERAFEAFVLAPRERWDEKNPLNPKARDWWPWRYNRRLSIMRRPLVQLSVDDNPVVLVMPSILAGTLDYLQQAAFGRLPEEMFDSPEMLSCIGRAADRIGHEFNRKVAGRFQQLKWTTLAELSLAQLGGSAALGDIDVLAWRPDTGLVFAVECKSLRFDRTLGEIGERLAEYSTGTVDGQRTRLQRHLDRISYLKDNRGRLSALTKIPVERLKLRSALVTEKPAPMQFSAKVREALDVVADYKFLEEAIGFQ